MIQRINAKKWVDVKELLMDGQDIFITKDNSRIYLSRDNESLKEVLSKQVVFGLYDNGLQGILIIYKEKNYRTFLKVSAKTGKIIGHLLKYLVWNYPDSDLYIKVNKVNSINRISQYYGFKFLGFRGEQQRQEVLLYRQKTEKHVMTPKDADEQDD